MQKDQSYQQIFKSTSVFGGVQVFNIIVSIIRSKLIAILLGPVGIGIAGLLNSTMSLIATITNLGLERSAVKNVATAHASANLDRISVVVTVVRRLVWITGIVGTLIVFLFSSYFSQLTFDNNDYSFAFKILSVTILLNQLTAGQMVILRGMRKLNYMAKASLYGAIAGLVFSIPLYYFFGLKGIVPAIVITSFSALIIVFSFSRKVPLDSVKITPRQTFSEGKSMVSVGFVLSLSTLATLATSYVIRLYIRSKTDVEAVGFYDAGFAIVNSYFGVIFSALVTDYYPRLAGIAHNNTKATLLMNQQSEMSILILSPILVIFLVFINQAIVLLYSSKFLSITTMILWASLGIFFKAASWSLGVIFISKGDVKTLLWSELSANAVVLISGVLGYKLLGLEGLGVSFVIGFFYAFIQTYLIVRFKYAFSFTKEFYKIFFVQLSIGIITFMIVRYCNSFWSYIYGSIFIGISIWFSVVQLKKRIDILSIFRKNKK